MDELLFASPISAGDWVTATQDERSQYISRLHKLLTKEEQKDIEKVAISFMSMWKMGKWHEINLKPDDYEARKMKEEINSQVESMIIEDMVIFKKKGKSFEEWAKDSVWSKDTGGPKDPSTGAPVRALSGRWKELWEMTGSRKRKSKKKKSKKKKPRKRNHSKKKIKHSRKKKYSKRIR